MAGEKPLLRETAAVGAAGLVGVWERVQSGWQGSLGREELMWRLWIGFDLDGWFRVPMGPLRGMFQ